MAALPTTGITTSLVAQTIGVGSNDVGTLCSHQNVNKWSKWKPISIPKVTGITIDDLKNSNFGLLAKEISDIVTYSINNGGTVGSIASPQKWTYTKPFGGTNSPYRIGDFRNYNHQAACSVVDVNDISLAEKDFDSWNTSQKDVYWYPSFRFGEATYDIVGNLNPNQEINLFELTIISGSTITDGHWRIGLAIYVPSQQTYYIASSIDSLSPGRTTSDIYKCFVSLLSVEQIRTLLYNMPLNTYYVAIPFFAYDLQLTSNGFDFIGTGRAFSFPNAETIKINRIDYTLNHILDFYSAATSDHYMNYPTALNLKSIDSSKSMGDFTKTQATSQSLRIQALSNQSGIKMDTTKAGTFILFKKTNGDWIKLDITEINGTTGEITLSTSTSQFNYIVAGFSSELKQYISGLARITGEVSPFYNGQIRIINDYTDIGTIDIRYNVSSSEQ
jgi:hypothetical protein